MYATGFAAYANTLVDLPSKVWAVGVVHAFTAVNFLGSRMMGRAESVIVIVKVVILIVFIAAAFIALPTDAASRLSPATWSGPLAIFTGAGVLFVGYEGFGLITNAAASMASPKRELARAIYGSVARLIAVAALLSTASAVNATLYGSTNLAYQIAKNVPIRGPFLPHDHHRADISDRSRRHAYGELLVRGHVPSQDAANLPGAAVPR